MSYRKHGDQGLAKRCFKETALKDVKTSLKIITLQSALLTCVFDFYIMHLLQIPVSPQFLGVLDRSCLTTCYFEKPIISSSMQLTKNP